MADLVSLVTAARAAVEAGSTETALVYYRMVLADTTPPHSGQERVAHGEACVMLARHARQHGRMGEATDYYREACHADPLANEYRIEYARRCLLAQGLRDEARAEAIRATKIDPGDPDAWKLLGGVEHQLGNAEAAIAAYDRQIELRPDDADTLLDRATIDLDLGRYGEAANLLMHDVLMTPRRADALHCLAMVAARQARHEDAIELYKEAIAGGCFDKALASWNKALSLHAIGRYREGWAAHEARGMQTTNPHMALCMNRFTTPIWPGPKAAPPPARLHIHQEMGFGDAIALARYAPLLAEQGYDVRLEVSESLVDLFAHSPLNAIIMPRSPDYPGALRVPPFDYHVPMLSLPAIMGTEIETVPWYGPYLQADPKRAREYDDLILPNCTRIGLCWSAGVREEGLWLREYGRRKSISFDRLQPLMRAAPNAAFVSLQVGPPLVDGLGSGIIYSLPSRDPTWAETAALIANLDLVITVDTAVAHLAAAMGKPVWVLMQRDGASWHWMCWRPDAPWNEKSPWYPSARLFRQHEFNRPHYWDEVIDDVAAALRQFVPMIDAGRYLHLPTMDTTQ